MLERCFVFNKLMFTDVTVISFFAAMPSLTLFGFALETEKRVMLNAARRRNRRGRSRWCDIENSISQRGTGQTCVT